MRVYERGSERWEIELQEQLVLTRQLENAALVDSSTTAHASPLRAKWEADRICARLAADGFARTDTDDVLSLGKREFEDALRANPDDRETYLVYADWLSERGDDWGQLIAIQHALETLPRFGQTQRRDELTRSETLLRFKLSAQLWGALGETIYNEETQRYLCDLIDTEWRCGFLHSARLNNYDDAVFGALVRGLHDLPIALVLRDLTLACDEWEPKTIEEFTSRTWPSLERLTITSMSIDATRLVAMMQHLPRLLSLELWGLEDADEMCTAIASSPIVAQLQTLTLRKGDFSRDGVLVLASSKLALQSLDIGETEMQMRERLQRVAKTVRIHVNG